MTEAVQDEQGAIDPGWCPARDTAWQRCYHLVQPHLGRRNPPEGCGRRRRAGRGSRTLVKRAAVRLGAAPARTALNPGEHPQDHTGRGRRAAGEADAGCEVGPQPYGSTAVPRPRRTSTSPPQARRAPGKRRTARQAVRAAPTGPWWSSSARGSTTSANAPRNSPNNAGRISISSGCAGSRTQRAGRARIRWALPAACSRHPGAALGRAVGREPSPRTGCTQG